MRSTLILGAVMAMGTAQADDVLYYMGFENPAWIGGKYYDYDSSIDHALVNNEGEAAVNVEGMSAYYQSTGGVGLQGGDYFGVTNYTGTVGSFFGDQGYQMSDVDGIVTLATDDYADATGYSVNLFLQNTGYEGSNPLDFLSVTMGGEEVFYSEGDDLELITGEWFTVSGSGSGALAITFSSNSGTEALFIDEVYVYGVPAPGALALLGIAGLATRRRS